MAQTTRPLTRDHRRMGRAGIAVAVLAATSSVLVAAAGSATADPLQQHGTLHPPAAAPTAAPPLAWLGDQVNDVTTLARSQASSIIGGLPALPTAIGLPPLPEGPP